MRQLNEDEKSIIKTIVQAKKRDEHSLVKLIHDYVDASVISWDDNFQYLEIFDDSSQEDTIMVKFNKLLEIIFLLDYLRDNMYIGIYSRSKLENAIYSHYKYKFDKESSIIEKIILPDSTDLIHPTHVKICTTFSKKVCEYANSYFFVSESLLDLVKHNFLSEEQRRFEKQMKDTQKKYEKTIRIANYTLKWTQVSFGVAFISTMATFIVGIFEPKDMTIRELSNIIKKKSTHEAIDTKLTNDTIMAIITTPSLNDSKAAQ